jgi:thymidylate synthase
MSQIDVTYNRLLDSILKMGYNYRTANRPDIDCRQIASVNMEVTLETFPLITTKEMYWKGIVAELIWFLRGDQNIKFLVDNDVHIWDKDAYNWYKKLCSEQDTVAIDFIDFLTEVKAGTKNVALGDYTYGDVGLNYGVQWRKWAGHEKFPAGPRDYIDLVEFDQIKNLIVNLNKTNPINRRHIVTAWNPDEVNDTALPPCHWSWEIIPRPLFLHDRINLCRQEDQEPLAELWGEMSKGNKEAEEKLRKSLVHIPKYAFTLKWHQRSVDTFLGLPFNIASYALLAHIIGELTEMLPLELIGDLSNVHIYGPHNEMVTEQLSRNPLEYPGCHLELSERFVADVEKFKKGKLSIDLLFKQLQISDFQVPDYESFGKLKAEMFEPTE